MITASANLQASEDTPKPGEVLPIHIFSPESREIDKGTVANLAKALKRDGSFIHPIVVREEGKARYRLVAGYHRLQAWERHFGKLQPITALIYTPDTPNARIDVIKIEENLLRNDLTAAERTVQEMRWTAAIKKLNGGKPVTAVSGLGEAAGTGNLIPSLPPARGGRGKKGMAQQVANKFGIGKRAVNMRRKAAAAVIGEEIDLDDDAPEELERKAAELERRADKRHHAEPKVVRLKRKASPRDVTEDSTQPAEPHAGEIDNQIEAWLKAFDTFGETHQFRLAYLICIRLGLDPLLMAPPAVFGLDNEEPGLPAEVAPATDAVAEQAEHGDHVAVAHAEEDDEAAAVQASQGDNGAEFGAQDLQDAGDDVLDAADPVIGAKERCAHCDKPFLSSDLPRKKFGRFWHRKNCVNHAKPIAIAA